MLTTPMKRLS
uniref:Uncharacterized protein n=1 Tax=Rhodnius prolixus TaxID=13249 RepID=A0A0G2KBG6_RHOPR